MQFIHQAHYGHIGSLHTAKPVMAMRNNHIYEMKNGRPDTKALYVVRDNKVYSTSLYPTGENAHAVFEIRNNKIHTTPYHPNHDPNSHAFEIKSLM